MQFVVKSKIFFVKLRKYGIPLLTSVFDSTFFHLKIPLGNRSKFKPLADKKTIVYLGEYTWPRISRIAKRVKKDFNISPVLICSAAGFKKEFISDSYDHIIVFRNKWHLRRILEELKQVYLIHSYGMINEYPALAVLHYKGKVIYDAQDVWCCYYGLDTNLRWLKKDMAYERINFTQSKGIVAQSPEPIIGRKLYNKKIPSIFFPIYCDDDVFVDSSDKKMTDDDIHLVYAGGIADSSRDPAQYGNIQFHWLIEKLGKQKIHFHIYPSPATIKAEFDEYKKIAEKNSYFHFHDPISLDKLSKELTKYHFGLLPFFSGRNRQSENKYKYATAFKLFNYIEAGIPVITSENLFFQSWIVKRYQCGIAIKESDVDNMRDVFARNSYSDLIKQLVQGREKLSLKKQIPRLMKFYENIVAGY